MKFLRHFKLSLILCVIASILVLSQGCKKTDPSGSEVTLPPVPDDPGSFAAEASKTRSIFYQHKIQEAQQNYQHAYLDLITKINTLDTKSPGKMKEQMQIFYNYSNAVKNYREVLKKVREYEKTGTEKCNSVMRSLVSAVQVYDKLANKKMFKYDPQKLIEAGILKEPLVCPREGEFTIYYKDGRRVFRCSVHGTLKQR